MSELLDLLLGLLDLEAADDDAASGIGPEIIHGGVGPVIIHGG